MERNDSIAALIISTDEPQLNECVKAVNNQIIPFSSIIHINNVVPESRAFNSGMIRIKNKWFMKIDGDMILYTNAVKMFLSKVTNDTNIFMYSFGLYDEFLKAPIIGCGVFLTEAFQKIRYRDSLANDIHAGRRLIEQGYKRKNYSNVIMIGTHFSHPDKFQTFRRFYSMGVKYGSHRPIYAHMQGRITELLEKTKDNLYLIASDGLRIGADKRYYPTSHNIIHDKRVYEDYKSGVFK